MATVAAGASASETFSATANTVQITLDAGERAHVTVLSSAGALLYRNNLQNSQTIGPFAVGSVMSITAIGGSIDYTVVDGDEYFTRPVGITPSGASVAPDGSAVSGGGNVTISGDVTITAANAATYNGKTLVWSAAAVVTLSAGLPDAFGFAGRPPASGSASIASANTGGLPTLDGATTTVTRTLAANKLFAVTGIGTNTYTVTGS